MTDQYIRQLSSGDSEQRRQAIIALGKSGDKSALTPLLNIYKNDPDPELRELALKAGRYLKSVVSPNTSSQSMFITPKRAPDQAPPPASANSDLSNYAFNTVKPEPTIQLSKSVSPFKDSYFEEPEPVAPPSAPPAPIASITPPEPSAPSLPMPSKEITYRERAISKGRVDQAMAYRMQGNIPKAQSELAEAFRINPDLVNDNLAANLATTLTGAVTTEEAVEELNILVQKSKQSSGRIPIPGFKSAAAPAAAPATVQVGEVIMPVHSVSSSPLELILQIVLVFGIEVVFVFLLITYLSHVFAVLPTPQQNSEAFNTIRNLSGPTLVKTALGYALIVTIVTLFTDCIFFGVGTMLGGVGDLSRVLRGLLWVHIVSTIISAVAAGIEVFSFAPGAVAASTPTALTGFAQLLSSVVGLGSFIALVIILARTHEYSILRSIATILISSFSEACIIVGLAVLVLRSAPQ